MALYNNGYPATYQPLYPYTQVAPVQQQTPSVQPSVQGGINWIQGEQAAKSYLVAPNNSVVLFDSESQSIYIKSADASGMPSMKVLDYTIREVDKPNTPVNSAIYATNGDIERLNGDIEMLKKKLEKLTKRMKEETEDE